MTTSPPCLLALESSGAVTAIGNSVQQTLASWVGQVRRMRKVKLDGFSNPFTIAPCLTASPDLHGMDKLATMLGSAVAEAFEARAHAAVMDNAPCLEILLLPQWLTAQECEQLSQLLTRRTEGYAQWCAQPRERLVLQVGASGAWTALEHAYRALADKPQLKHIMIVAVDSACEPGPLTQAARANWLIEAGNTQGYIAGEAAACLHLSRVKDITQVPAKCFALHRPTLQQASALLWPEADRPDATPLAQALTGALKTAGMQAIHISHLESDMDGSDWRAHFESTALSRVIFSQTTALPQLRPANLLGQCGAAHGLLNWLIPAALHAHGIERINTVLNWAVEPSGAIAACVLERSPN
jgi:3-oxoacyl-[acyl-carrier-protein] synthase I